MSKTKSAVQATTPIEPFISEMELGVRLGYATRTMLDLRKNGKLPPHFLATSGRAPKQVRYLLKDVEAYERALKSKT